MANWAEAHHKPLSIKKSSVLHCGRNQPSHAYTLCGLPTIRMGKILNLGVIRSLSASYKDQCQAVAAKAMTSSAAHLALTPKSCYGPQFNHISVRCLCTVCLCGHLMQSMLSQYWGKYKDL